MKSLAELQAIRDKMRQQIDLRDSGDDRIRVVVSDDRKSRTAAAVFAALADLFPWMEGLAAANPAFFERLDVKRSQVEA